MTAPLVGVRVLDLSRMLTGGFATMILGDLGAEIIKIEPPPGDPLRKMPPHFLEEESAYFLSISRNKKSICLDLKKDQGREIFYELVRKSDVVFDNFRHGVLERLCIGYERLKKINPKIVCCSITAYGQTGPLKDEPGFDLVIQALSGMMSYTGEPGGEPLRMGAPMGDLAGSLYAAIGMLSALAAREREGTGRAIDLSLLDCLVSLHTYVSQYYWIGNELPLPVGSGHASVVPYRSYRTRDGHFTVAVFVEKFWQGLCNALGKPELGDDERYNSTAKRLLRRKEIDDLLEMEFRQRTNDEWAACLQREKVPGAPVLTMDEVLSDQKLDPSKFETSTPPASFTLNDPAPRRWGAHQQLIEREMIVDVPLQSGKPLKMLGNPLRQTGSANSPLCPPPKLGQHTQEVLERLLGYDEEHILRLEQNQIVKTGIKES